jgi:tetratricopeptide (TPR) repeat protein
MLRHIVFTILGYLRQQSGQASADETMQAYQDSLQIKRRVLGRDNLSVGKTLNNLGTVHYLKREYDQALEAYREALQIMVASLGPNHLDVGTVHSNIGDVFWAQSGDAKFGDDLPQRNYQTSRDAALTHYRYSLAIRWEELQDHHDPKVIRLLEKIAALEMGESFLALVQSTHRQSPKEGDAVGEEGTVLDADEAMEAETSLPLVYQEARTLHLEVKEDVKAVDMMERKLAIDMVKDKLRFLREMKKLNLRFLRTVEEDELGVSLASGTLTPIKVKPLSPDQRTEALSAVKERLCQLRQSRSSERNIMRRHTVAATSDLKEADCSPANFLMNQRASHILNRALRDPQSYADENDELPVRKFSFNFGNQPETAVLDDISEMSDITRSTRCSLSVSRRTVQALDEGIHALRSQSINQDVTTGGDRSGTNPWAIASTLTIPERAMSRPETPLWD